MCNGLEVFDFRKCIKRTVGIVVFAIIFYLIVLGLNYIYYDEEEWGRIMWHNYYAEEENIDYVYIGNSLVYCGLDPFLMDSLNQKNNFNLSSSGQTLNGTYYLLKEADAEHDLEHVYVQLNYDLMTGEGGDFYTDMSVIRNWRNTDYMRKSWNWLEYVLTMSESDKYFESFVPFARMKKEVFDLEHIKGVLRDKRQESYKSYEYKQEEAAGITEYRDKGSCYITKQLQMSKMQCQQGKSLVENPITEDAEYYLRKVIEYCEAEGLELTLYSSPIYALKLLSVGNYDAYSRQVKGIAEEYDVPYYDFNLCKEEYLPIQARENYVDFYHLNTNGAKLLTTIFHEVMSGQPEETQTYFCDSYEEKLSSMEAKLLGVVYTDESKRQMRIISNREEEMKYNVTLYLDDGSVMVLQDFTNNTYVALPENVKGTLQIIARNTADETMNGELEYLVDTSSAE